MNEGSGASWWTMTEIWCLSWCEGASSKPSEEEMKRVQRVGRWCMRGGRGNPSVCVCPSRLMEDEGLDTCVAAVEMKGLGGAAVFDRRPPAAERVLVGR